jgi:hypothetical protein
MDSPVHLWGAAKLKTSMMKHFYKQKFGEEAMANACDMCVMYDPLSL